MLQPIVDLPPGIIGLKAVGTVSKDDYTTVLEPMLEAAEREDRRIRFLYELGAELDTFTPGAAWEDLRVGVQHVRLFEGCAILSDLTWIRDATRLVGFAMPCPVRVFGTQEREQAIAWLASLPEQAAAAARMIPSTRSSCSSRPKRFARPTSTSSSRSSIGGSSSTRTYEVS